MGDGHSAALEEDICHPLFQRTYAGAFALRPALGLAGAGFSTSRLAARSALPGPEPPREAVEIDGFSIVHSIEAASRQRSALLPRPGGDQISHLADAARGSPCATFVQERHCSNRRELE